MRRIEFIILRHDGDETVLDMAAAKSLGITDAESLVAAFGSEAELRAISLRPATKRLEQEIERGTYIYDAVTGAAQHDPSLLPQKRALALIDSWSGFSRAFSEDAYLDLPPSVANFIGKVLLKHMYPSAMENPAFFAKLKKLQEGSA